MPFQKGHIPAKKAVAPTPKAVTPQHDMSDILKRMSDLEFALISREKDFAELNEMLNQIQIKKETISRMIENAPRINKVNTGVLQIHNNISALWDIVKTGFVKDFFTKE